MRAPRSAASPRPGAGSPPPEFRYRAVAPWASFILRGALDGPFGWWTRLRYTEVSVTEPGAALSQAAPAGAHGGRSTLLHAGLVYDTRDRTSSPRRGWLADASFFGSVPGPLASHALAGANAGVRGYFRPWEGAVLAARALYDLKLGDVPFFERSLYEGLGYGEGLGGAGTIRGLARDRLSGQEKVLVGVELRAWLAETWWLGGHQEWGVSAGADGGRARDRGHPPISGWVASAGCGCSCRRPWWCASRSASPARVRWATTCPSTRRSSHGGGQAPMIRHIAKAGARAARVRGPARGSARAEKGAAAYAAPCWAAARGGGQSSMRRCGASATAPLDRLANAAVAAFAIGRRMRGGADPMDNRVLATHSDASRAALTPSWVGKPSTP